MEVMADVVSSADPGAERTLQPRLEALSAEDAQPGGRSTVDLNTDADWEEQLRSVMESGSKLSQDFNALKLQQQQDELDFIKNRSTVQKRRDQAVKQHQVLLEKLESVRVKLQLNNSKATRKNFLTKIQEMTLEKSRAQEERDRLGEDLAEAEARLSALQLEQEAERRQWEQDLSDLRRQTESAQKDDNSAQAKAQRDTRAALEKHRDTADEMVTAWINQVGVYLDGLRAELPHRHRQEKPQWDRREATVKRSQAELQTRISELLQQLDRHELENLPPISLPDLPQVPMAELYFHRIMQMTPRLPAPPHVPPPAMLNPRPPILLHAPPRHVHLPMVHAPFLHQHYHPPHLPLVLPPPHLHMPMMPIHALPHRVHAPDNDGAKTATTIGAPPAVAPPAVAPPAVAPPAVAPPAVAPPAVAPPDVALPAGAPPAGAAGKLGKVLEKLGVHFPRCSRAQLTWFLQQVKSERGTLAGLSMEEVVDQIRQKAETSLTVGAPTHPAGPAPLPGPRKPCLVCQKPVDAATRFELKCTHTVHAECIQVWLQSSKSNSCPFCPSK